MKNKKNGLKANKTINYVRKIRFPEAFQGNKKKKRNEEEKSLFHM